MPRVAGVWNTERGGSEGNSPKKKHNPKNVTELSKTSKKILILTSGI
jgi:hypothetical protein